MPDKIPQTPDEAETTLEGPSDPCVICKADTGIPINRPVNQRMYYVIGAGQHCQACYLRVHPGSSGLPEEG